MKKKAGNVAVGTTFGLCQNGDIQTQIERPHPDNTDVDCDDCTMSDIGMTMNDGWIGLKHIVYPEVAGGDVDNGGIRIKFYISTDAIGSNGLPTNDWELVFDTLDTGQWLGDYKWPMYQELEMRLSDIDSLNDLQLYKDRVFIRRWIRGMYWRRWTTTMSSWSSMGWSFMCFYGYWKDSISWWKNNEDSNCEPYILGCRLGF